MIIINFQSVIIIYFFATFDTLSLLNFYRFYRLNLEKMKRRNVDSTKYYRKQFHFRKCKFDGIYGRLAKFSPLEEIE